ncbi:hypothetical protein GGR58DRAFT_111465 [Xylaria digitata]|nr:hypothetical protein GGR58DRAFT_111465 [Xylaria digitata]
MTGTMGTCRNSTYLQYLVGTEGPKYATLPALTIYPTLCPFSSSEETRRGARLETRHLAPLSSVYGTDKTGSTTGKGIGAYASLLFMHACRINHKGRRYPLPFSRQPLVVSGRPKQGGEEGCEPFGPSPTLQTLEPDHVPPCPS